jgi:hypothetical protein
MVQIFNMYMHEYNITTSYYIALYISVDKDKKLIINNKL